jgi:hypothetical protein
LTTVYDDWNREKIGRLQGAVYTVEVLWERTYKEYVGSEVRRLIAAGDEEYLTMVPPATARAIQTLDLRSRLAQSYRDPT